MNPSLSWKEFMRSDGVKAMFFVETYAVSDWEVGMPLATDWHTHYSLQRKGRAVPPASVSWQRRAGVAANMRFGVAADNSGLITVDFHSPNADKSSVRNPNATARIYV